MGDYPEAYVAFMHECKAAYGDLCERITNGDVPAGAKATVTITIPASIVDRVRFDVLAAAAEAN